MADIPFDQETGDIDIGGDSDVELTNGQDGIEQRIWFVLRTNEGTWFADETVGIDYKGKVWPLRNPTAQQLNAAFVSKLLAIDGVLGFEKPPQYSFDKQKHQVFATFWIKTTEGPVEATI